MYIDTHAHLNYPDVLNNLDDILSRALDSDVESIIVPATNYRSSLEVVELVQKHKMLYGAVGIHPNDLSDFDESHFVKIEELAKENKIVAIGEIGLDYYREPYDKELQQRILRSQLQIAKKLDLPVVIHNRNSSDDLMKLVAEEYENGKLKGQFHSFSGDEQMAKKCVDMGFYISLTGNITYKPNQNTLTAYEIVKNTGVNHLLLETDTPYLPPVPY
ncbi:MAG: TatD family hydrolase, partial [Chlorobi bacterium]|nr:TatD family hydrolase [Chlorobiota bacterium]